MLITKAPYYQCKLLTKFRQPPNGHTQMTRILKPWAMVTRVMPVIIPKANAQWRRVPRTVFLLLSLHYSFFVLCIK